MTGIPQKELTIQVDAAQIMRQIVHNNQVIVGSVNSNRSHFEMALNDMPAIRSQFGNMLDEMITHRFKLPDYESIFVPAGIQHIKTIIEIDPW